MCFHFGLTPFVLTQTVPPAEGLAVGASLVHEQSFRDFDQGQGITWMKPTALNDFPWNNNSTFGINSQFFHGDCPYDHCTRSRVVPFRASEENNIIILAPTGKVFRGD